jgi:hypothetical protein
MRESIQLSFDVRQRTALHEASHAVAAKTYGLPIEFAEVHASVLGEQLGRVVHKTCGYA